MTNGFDRSSLKRITPWMQGWVDRGQFPGAQVLITRGGEIAFEACVGSRDIASMKPWTDETIVRVYSMTKPVTSIAALMLFERAQLHLETPVDEILPAFKDRPVLIEGATRLDQVEPAKTRLTVHHLMTHTSGLTYGFNEGLLAKGMRDQGVNFSERNGDLAHMTDKLAALPLGFDPGSRWNYSVSTDVLGRVVEVVSGKPLDQFFAEEIFGPLGMHDTSFDVSPDKIDRLASCYTKTVANPLKCTDPYDSSAYAKGQVTLLSGGGGLVSTAHDYFKFAEMLRQGGRSQIGLRNSERLVGRKTIDLMRRNALPGDLASMGQKVFSETSFEGIGFGLGVSVTLDPALAHSAGSVGDFGWGGMASTVFWVDPAEDLVVIFLTQLIPSSSYPNRRELRAMTYGALN